jgi:ribokinase
MRKLAVVSGYATVDFPVRLPVPLNGAQTATVETLAKDSWPRPGGAALYASRRIAAAGHRACALVALGQDASGTLYLDACRAAGVELSEGACIAHLQTPWCMLLYHDEGNYTCLIDRGDMDQQVVSDAQRTVLASADLVCIAAGPSAVTATLIDWAPPSATLAWIAKRDAVSFPQALNERLARRADLVFCNASERSMVDAARLSGVKPGQSIIETRGAEGVLLESGDRRVELPSPPVRVRDTTGAGDTLAGEVLATLLSGKSDLEGAVRRGIDAVHNLLLRRRS